MEERWDEGRERAWREKVTWKDVNENNIRELCQNGVEPGLLTGGDTRDKVTGPRAMGGPRGWRTQENMREKRGRK